MAPSNFAGFIAVRKYLSVSIKLQKLYRKLVKK